MLDDAKINKYVQKFTHYIRETEFLSFVFIFYTRFPHYLRYNKCNNRKGEKL